MKMAGSGDVTSEICTCLVISCARLDVCDSSLNDVLIGVSCAEDLLVFHVVCGICCVEARCWGTSNAGGVGFGGDSEVLV